MKFKRRSRSKWLRVKLITEFGIADVYVKQRHLEQKIPRDANGRMYLIDRDGDRIYLLGFVDEVLSEPMKKNKYGGHDG